MTQRLPDELQDRLEAKGVAEIESYFDERERDLRRQLESLDRERHATIEAFKRQLKGKASDNGSSPPTSLIQETDTSRGSQGIPHDSRKLPNRREMLLAVLPDFGDQDFIRRDVEGKIIERWPQAEPRTSVEAKNFGSRLAGLLSDMVRKGQLEATKGENSFDPPVYRLKKDHGDTRLE